MSKARDLADSVAAGGVLADGAVSLSEVGGGTSNGVVFVNGSGTTTSGSALTFDGSKLEASNGTVRVSNTSGYWTNLTPTGLTNFSTSMDFDSVGSYLFKIGGSEQMRLTTTGLGIGTSSPAYKLDSVSSGNTQVARFRTGGDATTDVVSFERNDGLVRAVINYNGTDGCMTFGTTTNHPIAFRTNNTEKLRLDSSGNLLVGVTGVGSGSHKLVVESASTTGTINSHIALIGDSATNGQGPQILFSESGDGQAYAGGTIGFVRTGSNGIGDLLFGTRGAAGDANTITTERVRITSAGNVGIGTDSPTQKLTLSNGTFHINGTSTFISNVEIGRVGGDNNMGFATGGSERMRIDSAGNVGIGTTSSTNVKLQINATSDTLGTGSLGLGGGSAPLFVWRLSSATANLNLDKIYGGVWDTPITIDRQYGNVGIGTISPTTRFETNTGSGGTQNIATLRTSNVQLKIGTTDIGNGEVYYNVFPSSNSSAAGAHIWQGGGSERARIDSSGNLLVGTTSSYSAALVTSATGGYSSGTINAMFVNPAGRSTVRLRSLNEAGCEIFFDTGGGVAWDISARSVAEGKAMHWYPSAPTPSYDQVGGHVMALSQTGNLTLAGNLAFNSGYGSAATAYGCRAWISFNGANTIAIRASGGVSSIGDNGTGNYTVYLTTAMPDSNYATVGTCEGGSRDTVTANATSTSTTNVTTGTSHISGTTSGVYIDKSQISVAFFR
tara:strand:- start:216 stop:2390 length:2175 start_codon:yes stop_codon:yes gene_type:complete